MLGAMGTLATILVVLVTALHAYFAVLEMALWTRPAGRAAFGLDREFAVAGKSLAANQGLYNLFLVAGLVWGLVAGDSLRTSVLVFFLTCVVVAGAFCAATVSPRILYVQAVPGALALAAVLVSR